MAKKAEPPSIHREKMAWGVRLTFHPFNSDSQFANMEITADVNTPKPKRGAEIKVWFSGVPVTSPLRISELMAWIEALRAMDAEARKVGEELKK